MSKNEMEKRMDVEDRGEVVSHYDREVGGMIKESCGRCWSVAHIVIRKSGERAKACPKCLCYIIDQRDREEEALQQLKKQMGA